MVPFYLPDFPSLKDELKIRRSFAAVFCQICRTITPKSLFVPVLWIQIRIRIHLAVLDPVTYWEMRIRIQQYEN
jgi:hypothetical protein